MAMRNTPERWGSVSRFLHWTTLLLVLGLVAVGLAMDEMANSPDKIRVYALHKSTGITLLALGPKQGAHLLLPRLGQAVEPAREHEAEPWWRSADAAEAHPEASQTPAIKLPKTMPWPLD